MRRAIRNSALTIALLLSITAPTLALDASKLPSGANHDRAHRYATGQGQAVGVFDTVFYGIASPNHLGSRLLAQYSFVGKTPGQSPDPLIDPNDSHERLVADIIAGDDPVYAGVAPGALIYDLAIDGTSFDSRRAASAWLAANHGVQVFNLSASFGTNTNGASTESLYWDWFGHEMSALLVVAAGNTGGQITIPADAYNGIAVGAYDQANQARWQYSAYTLSGGAAGSEVRGKPDILAPGVSIADGISYEGHPLSGTSFAAPHVTGVAALLTDYAAQHTASDVLDHRGIKAITLNSARKRQIVGPEVDSPISYDSATANATFDKDYLDCSLAACSVQEPGTASTTNEWTPAGWSYAGNKFSVTKPLDDEQGVGFLDATRAIINLAGGNAEPGLVAGIGWDENTIATSDPLSAHTYVLDQTLAVGSFLTATLIWDRIVVEGDGNGIVDDVDTYAFGELANLDLRVLDSNDAIVAESISTTDNVEHLHVPLPTNGDPADYKLQVEYVGGGLLATDYALAWWIDPTPLVPGDYNLDGVVDAADFEVWRGEFGDSTDVLPLVRGDGNADGVVSAADYTIWRNHLGQSWSAAGAGSVGPTTVPEPAAWSLVGLALTGLAGRARGSGKPQTL